MTSSYLSGGGGGRAYGFDLDNIVKSPSLSARSSSPSSALSESGNYSSRTISTKRARTPRKRPNQTYTEAAALLSTVYPKVFSTTKSLTRIGSHRRFQDSSELLPTLILEQPLSETPSFNFEPKKPVDSITKAWPQTPPSNAFQQPGSPGPLADDFDTESILDEEVEDGIDSILGNLSSDANAELTSNRTVHIINPHLRSLMGSSSLAFGLGLRGDIRRALRNADAGDWWSPTVALKDIVPKFQALSSPSAAAAAAAGEKKKKKKKKVVVEELKESSPSPVSTTTASTTTTSSQQQESLNSTTLLLKLNHDDVLKEWSDRGSPFSPDASGAPESTADILARLADIDLFPEAAGGVGGEREASVMRYKEKRRSRLFSKKIRYQVRKVNADRRPRMKGRFIKRPSLLKEAIEQENL